MRNRVSTRFPLGRRTELADRFKPRGLRRCAARVQGVHIAANGEKTIQGQRLVGREKLPQAGLPGVLPERLVERAELDVALACDASARVEVSQPEADRIR